MNLMAYKYEKGTRAFYGCEMVAPSISGDRLIYQLPECATLIAPPAVPPRSAAVWQPHRELGEGHWLVLEDHRGEPGWVDWKGDKVIINRLGNPLDWQLRRAEAEAMRRL